MRAVNLIPAEHRAGASVGVGRSGGAAYAVLVVLAGFAVLAFLYGRADKQIASDRTQAATLTAQAQRAQAEASQLAPYTSFAQLREQRTKAVSQLVDSRFDWAHVFHEFGRVLPAQVSLTSLTGTIGSVSTGTSTPAAPAAPSSGSSAAAAPAAAAVTSATPPGSVPLFSLTGCATNQQAVALMLDRLRLIDGVSNVTLESSTKSGASSGGAGTSGGCASGQPVYTAQVAFAPLPTAAASHSATKAAASRAPAASTGGSTTPTGGAG